MSNTRDKTPQQATAKPAEGGSGNGSGNGSGKQQPPALAVPQDQLLKEALKKPGVGDHVWSSWHNEAADEFTEFASHCPEGAPGSALTPKRQLSSRQISGQFEDEVAKEWEEDWEDEDVEDTYDAVMTRIQKTKPPN